MGAEVPLFCETLETFVGLVTIVANATHVLQVNYDVYDPEIRPNSLTRRCKAQLAEYFAGSRRVFDLPLQFQGTAFQQRAWQALLKVPYGSTASYGQQAQLINAPKAARAVGAANNRNKLSIVVPCHRIIGAGGQLTGYAGGLERKRRLLAFELSAPASHNKNTEQDGHSPCQSLAYKHT